MNVLRARLQGERKLDSEIDDILKEKRAKKEGEICNECKQNVSAS
jgi:hypothetical protein